MRKQLLRIMVACAVCVALGVQGQSSSGSSGSSGSSSSDPSSSSGSSSSLQSGSSGSQSSSLSPTGRMSQQGERASQLTGAQVTDSSGSTLGTINDVIINPSSGRIDFAVLSLSSSATPGSTTSGTAATGAGEKLVPVPWNMLRSSSTASSSTSGGQSTFVFTGDKSKLEAAPSFSQDNWPDISQPSWRQSVLSHYGMSTGPATGGAESPSGTGTSGSSGGSSSPGSSSSGSSSSQDYPSSGSSSSGSSDSSSGSSSGSR